MAQRTGRKGEQPTTVYGDFKHEVIDDVARCVNLPFNIAGLWFHFYLDRI